MMRFVRRAAPALGAILAVGLSGCVSILPKTTPVQLYELRPELSGGTVGAGRTPVNVRLETLRFEEASAGDRLLTVRGGAAAYIGGARWVSPAQTLFEEGLARTFAAKSAGVRLLARSDAAGAADALSVTVESFRVNRDAPTPEVVVGLRARMIHYPDRSIVMDRLIVARRSAEADRVAAIVRAFDGAEGEALSTLVAAVDEAAAR